MRLTEQQWYLTACALGFVAATTGDRRVLPILKRIGLDGRKAARKGLKPSATLTPRRVHEQISTAERASAVFERMQNQSKNLKALLMNLGNRLVRRHRFKPAQAIFDRQRDAAFLQSTQMIAMFIAWLNQVPEARQILDECGFEWPLGQFRGKPQDDYVVTG